MMQQAVIGLGSNLANPQQQLQQALQHLHSHPHMQVLQLSSFYRSAPMGPQDQPDYLNAAVKISTRLSPHELLVALQQIEQLQGRERKQRWGARTLDLDILLYGQQTVNEADLIIPHCGISQRNFVLYPLRDLLDEQTMIPGQGILADLLAACPADGIEKLDKHDDN